MKRCTAKPAQHGYWWSLLVQVQSQPVLNAEGAIVEPGLLGGRGERVECLLCGAPLEAV